MALALFLVAFVVGASWLFLLLFTTIVTSIKPRNDKTLDELIAEAKASDLKITTPVVPTPVQNTPDSRAGTPPKGF